MGQLISGSQSRRNCVEVVGPRQLSQRVVASRDFGGLCDVDAVTRSFLVSLMAISGQSVGSCLPHVSS